MSDRNVYDLDGEKVLLLINVQKYPTRPKLELMSANVNVQDIKTTFKERVTLGDIRVTLGLLYFKTVEFSLYRKNMFKLPIYVLKVC